MHEVFSSSSALQKQPNKKEIEIKNDSIMLNSRVES
jgi:hypothetical protein